MIISREIVNNKIPFVFKNTDKKKLKEIFLKYQIKDIPFIDKEGLVRGYFFDDNPYSIDDLDSIYESDTINPSQITVEGDLLILALNKMITQETSTIAVIDKNQRFLGVVTFKEIHLNIHQFLPLEMPGHYILLNCTITNYSLPEIAMIVGSENSKIYYLNCFPEINAPERINIILKIDSFKYQVILKVLENKRYNIVYDFSGSDYHEDLKMHYDNLMKYLKI